MAIHVAFGLAVARWWAVVVAVPVVVVGGAVSPGSEDIRETGTKIVFALVAWLPIGLALIALGVAAAKLVARANRRARP